MRTSIVIRALNEAEHLPLLFDRLGDQTVQPDEIILVDSGSTDDTVRIAESYGASIVHIPPGDFTFGGSLNVGCERAKGDILILASAHVYPTDNQWIERLIAPFDNPAVGLSYGGQDADPNGNYSEAQLLQQWFPAEDDLDQNHPFCNNANCAVRRQLWEQFPYDETLTGLEDVAFARRLLDAGHKIAYVANARIIHVHDEHFRQVLNRYRREAIAYSEMYGSGSIDMRRSVRLFAENLRNDLRAAKDEGVLLTTAAASTKFRLAQFTGAYLGHRAHTGDGAEIVRRMYYPRSR